MEKTAAAVLRNFGDFHMEKIVIRLMNVNQLVGHAFNASIDLRPYCVEIMPFNGDGTNLMMWQFYPGKYDAEAEPDPCLVGRMILPGVPRVIDPIEGDGRAWVIEPVEDGLASQWRLEATPCLDESIWLDRSRDAAVLADETLKELHRRRTLCMYSLIAVERLLRQTDAQRNPQVYQGYESYVEAWRKTVSQVERAIAAKRVSR